MNYPNYNYSVIWSEEDKEYVGLCAEFPGLSCLDELPLMELEGIYNLVSDVVEDMVAAGEQLPEPLSK